MGLVAASTVSFSEVSSGSALASSLFSGRTDSGLIQVGITADGPFGKPLASLPMATDSFINRPDSEHHAVMCWDAMACRVIDWYKMESTAYNDLEYH